MPWSAAIASLKIRLTMMRVKAEAQAKEFDLKISGSSLSQVFEFQRGVTLQRRAPLTADESTC